MIPGAGAPGAPSGWTAPGGAVSPASRAAGAAGAAWSTGAAPGAAAGGAAEVGSGGGGAVAGSAAHAAWDPTRVNTSKRVRMRRIVRIPWTRVQQLDSQRTGATPITPVRREAAHSQRERMSRA